MKMSDDGQKLLKHYENCHKEAYPDPASPLGKECTRRGYLVTDYRSLGNWSAFDGKPWTIGWGHTGAEVKPGLVWTQKQCDDTLTRDLAKFEKAVSDVVTVKLNQSQFDALVDFTYNLGKGNLQASTLLTKLNGGDYKGAAAEFPKWRKAGGQVLWGLVKRRAAEQALFNGESVAQAIKIGDSQPRP